MTNPAESTTLQAFRDHIQKIKSYEEALGVMYWDLRTGAPKKAIEGRSQVIGTLSAEMFQLQTSDQYGEYLAALNETSMKEKLGEIDRRLLEESTKEYERNRKIPADRYEAYVVLTSKSESVWEEAKQQSDFSLLQPYLEEIVAFNHEFIDYWGYEDHKYNTLLDMYEPEMTVVVLDDVFKGLRDKLVPLLQQIQASEHQPDTTFLHQKYDEEKQRQFSLYILKEMGYDFDAGRLDISVHPFATGLNPGDVRITTNFREYDFSFSLFSTIHEGGHALYEQNIARELMGTTLCTGTSMGIHESQSRFWENNVGRSYAFWQRYYRELQRYFPDQFDQVELEQFYRANNVVAPSLIRIEADELTYNMHIMIRYELEKALFGGNLKVKDLPQAWNEKYEEYLGISADKDADGVLQDVHWSGGAFGYFPSYSLGNMYAAQIAQTLSQQMPTYENHLRHGELAPIKTWLTEQIYQYGKRYTPSELIEKVTGERLNSHYLVTYLTNKYKHIYRID